MKNILKTILVSLTILLCGCDDQAYVASRNISKDADNFKINRRVIFYNGITGGYMLTIEGRCSLQSGTSSSREVSIICKTGDSEYKKHFLGLSDNVTYFIEQMQASNESVYRYKVIFRPSTIIPDISTDLKGE